jgi:hypothetical protein
MLVEAVKPLLEAFRDLLRKIDEAAQAFLKGLAEIFPHFSRNYPRVHFKTSSKKARNQLRNLRSKSYSSRYSSHSRCWKETSNDPYNMDKFVNN